MKMKKFSFIIGFLFYSLISFAETSAEKKFLFSEEDTIQKSHQVLVYSFSAAVTTESAKKMDDFLLTRKGIQSCVTDIELKTTTITIVSTIDSKNIDELFEYAEKRFFNSL
jgi:ABC-type uncharacterized transport system involved in gliding motility auxiliary subunit